MLVSYSDNEQLEQLIIECNNSVDELFSNVEKNCSFNVEQITNAKPNELIAAIVGGGPSVLSTLESIREIQSNGGHVFALNGAAKFLLDHGIRADYQIVLDSRPHNLEFVATQYANEVLLCSQCNPSLFEKCQEIGYPARIWHACIDNIEKHIPEKDWINEGKPLLIGGGLTVGLSGSCLVYTLGYRNLHLFGYDSCHTEGKSHAYEQAVNRSDQITNVAAYGRKFTCSLTMAAQAHSFKRIVLGLVEHGAMITVHGDGLIPHIMKNMQREQTQRILTAVYDLGVSPPTYDFVSFLAEAERYRIAENFDRMDVVFEPGPIGGFRNDELPPDVEARKGMLWRICVPLANLVESVRNVGVLKERMHIPGDVFPVGYSYESPVSHYGTRYFKNGFPLFRASESAKRDIWQMTKRYATITLRQSSYWPARNSNLKEWNKVAEWLYAQNIIPIIIPDVDGENLGEWHNCREAAWDIDLRIALYESAVVNLGVSNGPMALQCFTDSNFITFKVVTENSTASKEFLASHGMSEQDNVSNGKWVWKEDTFDNIVQELSEFELLKQTA